MKVPPGASTSLQTMDREKLILDFRSYCTVDLQLTKRTTDEHVRRIKKYLAEVNTFTTESSRKYLSAFIGKDRYAHELKALRQFYKFLGKPNEVAGFKFPSTQFKIPDVPLMEEVRHFIGSITDIRFKALVLALATCGLRLTEVLSITHADIDWITGRVVPHSHTTSTTKKSNYSFLNTEALTAIKAYLAIPYSHGPNHKKEDQRIFPTDKATVAREFRAHSALCGITITAKKLRSFFESEMIERGISESYVNFLAGRVPASVLSKHYLSYRPEKLFKIYSSAGLKIIADSVSVDTPTIPKPTELVESEKVSSSINNHFQEDIKGDLHPQEP
ncbi:MAG: tyrosine-type recombinase/integrase [Rhabdochlamydiaceae bacterium]